ncbi:hypothetical protein [Citrobacter sp. FDAARGOS_156]|uniref:hypothetical protein n=1 Tax=Citrobacter sp. FDAARGOS_156 TaxID=1702170 RepID=UPI001F23DB2D|nr:hypothetical protein [Citrobacter sp. FDAARGOS_156]
MKRKRQAVQTHWLDTRQPAQRTGNEAVRFSDECWTGVCVWPPVRPFTMNLSWPPFAGR